MLRTIEALIDENGQVHLQEPVHLPTTQRAIVVILEDLPLVGPAETMLLSEVVLAEDWNRPEEDAAWSHLQLAQSS